ncbi:PIN domain-containing protein [Streptomyces sp. C10-9-1]|uniref:PIN domain-containing protein n=1 Tax=Streptomyces sp. C10-9-1 TaxID=1859285 RepID=UPI003F49BCD3
MRLNPGVTLSRADEVLRSALSKWGNARSSDSLARALTEAVHDTYLPLRETFRTPDIASGLHSPAYWQLQAHAMSSSENQPTSDPFVAMGWQISRKARNEIASLEIQRVHAELSEAFSQLSRLKNLADRAGLPIVVDTNILLHWTQLGDVRWREVLKEHQEQESSARLVVPLRVVDELDRQKYGGGDLANRADTAIRYLERTLRGTPPGKPAVLRDKGEATLEIWVDTDSRDSDADLAIIQCAADISSLHPTVGARVLTGDFGMRLRSELVGITLIHLPENHRKPPRPRPQKANEPPSAPTHPA